MAELAKGPSVAVVPGVVLRSDPPHS